jgi:hypothetical protein
MVMHEDDVAGMEEERCGEDLSGFRVQQVPVPYRNHVNTENAPAPVKVDPQQVLPVGIAEVRPEQLIRIARALAPAG